MHRSRLVLAGAAALAATLTGCGAAGGGTGSAGAGGTPSSPSPSTSTSTSSSTSASASSSASSSTSAGGGLALGGDWPTYHHDGTRQGAIAGPDPQSPGVAWRARLDGAVYASPLVVGGQVVAATEGGSLYSLEGRTGRVRWRRHLADPVPQSALPCGNIDPLGVTGTPVFDPKSRQLLAVATTRSGGQVRHVLFGVDAASGQVLSRRSVDAPGMQPRTHLQRGALLLANGRVYVPYGGNAGDCGQYRGRVVSLPVTGTGPLTSFAVPTTREGGIWAASGPAVLPGGDVLVTTGNGEATGGRWDRSDSVLRLTPGLRLRDGFAPRQWAQENSADADLGSTGPLVLPGGSRALAAGKGGNVYLLDVGHRGGVDGQLATLPDCHSYGGGAAIRASGGATAFLPCTGGLLQVSVRGDRLARGWQAGSEVTGSPVVVGGVVWSMTRDGTLVALATGDGRVRARVPVGRASRFGTPAASGSAVFVPTLTGVTAVRLVR